MSAHSASETPENVSTTTTQPRHRIASKTRDLFDRIVLRPGLPINNLQVERLDRLDLPKLRFIRHQVISLSEKLATNFRSICAIRAPWNGKGDADVATGWAIAPDVVVTNKHVVQDHPKFTVVFHNQNIPLSIIGNPIKSPHYDIAFVKVKMADIAILPLTKTVVEQADYTGLIIATVGHPKLTALTEDQLKPYRYSRIMKAFENYNDGLTFSIGKISPKHPITAQSFCHDCSTLKGNSGSPIFELITGDVVGLHYQSESKNDNRINFGIPIETVMQEYRNLMVPNKN